MVIPASWTVPAHIKAYTTTRQGGTSSGAYTSLNLGDHVDDSPSHVQQNRQHLIDTLKLPNSPYWLQQTHSTNIVDLDQSLETKNVDASYTRQAGKVCVVLTADCLPILLTDSQGSFVAAIHAGWRGLAAGIIPSSLAHLPRQHEILAWLGPSISQKHFEVGSDVKEAFAQKPFATEQCFIAKDSNKFLADIYELARQELRHYGVDAITGGDYCTYEQAELFYSYRRDGSTGRIASLIWIADNANL